MTALTDELSEFARMRLLSGLADTLRSISLAQGTPHSVNVDGDPRPRLGPAREGRDWNSLRTP